MSNPVTPLNAKQTAKQESKAASEGYFKRILVTEDQQINADTGGLPDETISARAARLAANGKGFAGFYGRWMCRFLNLWQRNHGPKAVAGDAARAQRLAANGKGFAGFYGRWMCRFLNLWQRNHGPKAVAGDAARAQRVLDTENESGLIDQ